MAGFERIDGALTADGVALDVIARSVGTPCWIYSAPVIRHAYETLRTHFAEIPHEVFFAMKANGNLAVIDLLHKEGCGIEIVSSGELLRALSVGVPGEKIVFAGVGKSRAEMAKALDANIRQFNVESMAELHRLNEVASEKGCRAPVALRINPDVVAGTHDKISTGRRGDKFGIDYASADAAFREAHAMEAIDVVGLHMHIGSQIYQPGPFLEAYKRVIELFRMLQSEGLPLHNLDLGGGFGVRYKGDEPPLDLQGLADTIKGLMGDLDATLFLEPGRFLVADAGILLTEVEYVKSAGDHRVVVLDAGMNDLIRPAMYDAWHTIEAVKPTADDVDLSPADIVGPICESSDVFARQRPLPDVDSGDLVAIRAAGAYGAVMSSHYNARAQAAEVITDAGHWQCVRKRVEEEEAMQAELLVWQAQSMP